ncbi:hypothetical protein HK104_003604, partial [Borealophlyctis nickersoniae]
MFARQKESGKLVCTTGPRLKDAEGVPDPSTVSDLAAEGEDGNGTPGQDGAVNGVASGGTTTGSVTPSAVKFPQTPFVAHLLGVDGGDASPSSARSSSPGPTSTLSLDRAALQQRIHQKLRMYNSASSSDDDDDSDSYPPYPHKGRVQSKSLQRPTPRHLTPTAITAPTRTLSPHQPHPDLTPTTDSAATSSAPTWPEVAALQSHYHDWPTQDARDWRKTKNFVIKLLAESGLLDHEITDPSEFVLHLISKIESNGFGLWSPKKGVCMGRALFPRASYFN